MINDLIIHLVAIKGYAKDVHYNSKSYGDHLLADRIQKPIDDFMDDLKENSLLGRGQKVKESRYYNIKGGEITPKFNYWSGMQDILIKTLRLCEDIQNMSIGDENLVGEIAQHLQTMYGLVTMIKDNN